MQRCAQLMGNSILEILSHTVLLLVFHSFYQMNWKNYEHFLDKLVLTKWQNVKLVLMKVLRKQTVAKMSNVLKLYSNYLEEAWRISKTTQITGSFAIISSSVSTPL